MMSQNPTSDFFRMTREELDAAGAESVRRTAEWQAAHRRYLVTAHGLVDDAGVLHTPEEFGLTVIPAHLQRIPCNGHSPAYPHSTYGPALGTKPAASAWDAIRDMIDADPRLAVLVIGPDDHLGLTTRE